MRSLRVNERIVVECRDPCGERVSKPKNRKLKGIPFYTKTAYFEHVTRYEKRWQEVTLKPIHRYDVGDGEVRKTIEIENPAVSAVTPDANKVRDLRRLVLARADEAEIREAFGKLSALDIEKVAQKLTANFVERKVEVAYDRELYLNAPVPFFGSSNTVAKLANDGTLTEATATVDTKLAEGISTLLPIKEVLSGAAKAMGSLAFTGEDVRILTDSGVQIDEVRPARDEADRLVIFLEIEDMGLVYEFRRRYPESPVDDDGKLEPIPFEPEERPHTVTRLAAPEPPPEAKKDERKISVSGDIVLPEPTADTN